MAGTGGGVARTEPLPRLPVEPVAAAPSRQLGPQAVAVAFGLVVIVSAVYFIRITSDSWFVVDEWPIARQVERAQDIADPYNGHLSLTILGLYRGLLELFGFSTYLPYRVAGIVSLVAVPVAVFLVARRRVGAPTAAIMGLLLLWFRGMSFEPGGLNHSLALLGGIVCGYALTGRGRRCDVLVAVGVTLALCSAGGGVAVAVAAVVHSLCSRATRERWLAVTVPSAAWLAWWVVAVPPDPKAVTDLRPGVPELAKGAVSHAAHSFRFLALGNGVLGGVLLAAFIVYAAWRLRQGLGAAANVLAWSAGLLVWWFGLMWSRWLLIDSSPTFRYQFVSVGFVLLAVLPAGRVTLPGWASASTRNSAILATTGVLLVAAFLALSVRPDVQEFARSFAASGRVTRAQAAVALDPNATVPDDVGFGFLFANMTAGQVRQVLETYGLGGGRGTTDELLVDIGAVRLTGGPYGPAPKGCTGLRQPISAGQEGRIDLYASAGSPKVKVRRFGTDWVTVGRLEKGRLATLFLSGYHASEEWEWSAAGDVCALAPRP
jgi:hypothetical protein